MNDYKVGEVVEYRMKRQGRGGQAKDDGYLGVVTRTTGETVTIIVETPSGKIMKVVSVKNVRRPR